MPINEIDHTGLTLENENSLVVIEVVSKAMNADVYLLRDHIKGSPEIKAGGYFVTGGQLDVMIIGYETGLWMDSLGSEEEIS